VIVAVLVSSSERNNKAELVVAGVSPASIQFAADTAASTPLRFVAMFRTFLLALFVLTATAFAQTPAPSAKHPFTFEDMMKLKRVDGPVPSPDGKWVVFSATDVDLARVDNRRSNSTSAWKRKAAAARQAVTKSA
jgi:hypothetical protein